MCIQSPTWEVREGQSGGACVGPKVPLKVRGVMSWRLTCSGWGRKGEVRRQEVLLLLLLLLLLRLLRLLQLMLRLRLRLLKVLLLLLLVMLMMVRLLRLMW